MRGEMRAGEQVRKRRRGGRISWHEIGVAVLQSKVFLLVSSMMWCKGASKPV